MSSAATREMNAAMIQKQVLQKIRGLNINHSLCNVSWLTADQLLI